MPEPFPPEFRRDVVAVASKSDRRWRRSLVTRDLGVVSGPLVESRRTATTVADRPGGRSSSGAVPWTPAETSSGRYRCLGRKTRRRSQFADPARDSASGRVTDVVRPTVGQLIVRTVRVITTKPMITTSIATSSGTKAAATRAGRAATHR